MEITNVESTIIQGKKMAIVYHSADGDGYLSAIVMNRLYQIINHSFDDIQFFGYNYEPQMSFEKDLDGFTKVVFIDVTPPLDWFLVKKNEPVKNQQVIIIDHHKQKKTEITELFKEGSFVRNMSYIFDDDFAAAMLPIAMLTTWTEQSKRFLFDVFDIDTNHFDKNLIFEMSSGNNFAKFLRLVEHYDLWKWWKDYDGTEETASAYIYYWGLYFGINELAKEANTRVNQFLKTMDIPNFFKIYSPFLVETGIKKYQYEIENAKKLAIIDKGEIALIGGKTNNFITKIIEKDFPEVKVAIFYNVDVYKDPESCKISLRSIDLSVDVAKLAKELFGLGSGGHKNAAGAYSKIDKFLSIINNNDIFNNENSIIKTMNNE